MTNKRRRTVDGVTYKPGFYWYTEKLDAVFDTILNTIVKVSPSGRVSFIGSECEDTLYSTLLQGSLISLKETPPWEKENE